MTVLRSALFEVFFVTWTVGLAIIFIWMLVMPFRPRLWAVLFYLRGLCVAERVILGLRYRVVGLENLPPGPVLVAAKHQSAWETLKLHLLFDRPAVIVKQELLRVPLWGWFAARMDVIAVDRQAGAKAMRGMVDRAKQHAARGWPVVIFPQGTRTHPGEYRRYLPGVAGLYTELGLPLIPLALNAGVFWGRDRWHRRAGTITIEILPPIPPGLDRRAMMAQLEETLEAATDRLVVAVGGPATERGVGRGAEGAA